MDQPRFPRRSASHGTLRSTHSAHGCGLPPSPIRSFHKPLRSVHENSVLLQSPGALESMLKTTTETGDIGIFTIKPIPPSPLQHGTFPGTDRSHPRPRRSVDNLHGQNTARQRPFNRDAASEIVSSSGSEGQRSATTNFSPYSNGELGQRSFSMTTCSSRYLSHHRSTNTLQSQASSRSQLQRPRSPFPYPTRLKRPGVRPSSPALTENGKVDYSRMVEIDRVSYRTVHGHFKYATPHMPRKPHPLGLRADINRSTPSLHPPGPPPNFRGPPPPSSLRAPSPAPMTSWNPSLRTMSLTSMTNAYGRIHAPHDESSMSPLDPPPRYYDYTEHFESKPAQLTPPAAEFDSVSSRGNEYFERSTNPEIGDHLAPETLAAVFGEGDSAFFDCESQEAKEANIIQGLNVAEKGEDAEDIHIDTAKVQDCLPRPHSTRTQDRPSETKSVGNTTRVSRGTDVDLLPSQIGRDSIDTFNQSLDLDSKDVSTSYSFASCHANTTPRTKGKSPKRHVQVLGGTAPTIRSEQGVILRDDLTEGRETVASCHSITPPPLPSHYLPGTPELSRKENYRTLPNPQIVPIWRKKENSSLPPPRVDSLVPVTVPDSRQFRKAVSLLNVSAGWDPEGPHDTDVDRSLDDTQGMSLNYSTRRHKRNHAALRISTTNLPRDDNEGYPHLTPSCSTAPIISPKPISPARQLKVKNSIPQLMKALPPLPGDSGYKLTSNGLDVPEEDEFAEILTPFNLCLSNSNKSLTLTPPNPQPSTLNLGKDKGLCTEGPKFRLKIRTTESSETPSLSAQRAPRFDHELYASDTMSDAGAPSGHNKLKVRSPRRPKPYSPQSATVRRRPNMEGSQAVKGLLQQGPRDLFSVSPRLKYPMLQGHAGPLGTLTGSQALTISSISDGRVSPVSNLPPTPPDSKTKSYAGDKESDSSQKELHGLKKHLTHLRSLISASSNAVDSTAHTPNKGESQLRSMTDLHNGGLKESQKESPGIRDKPETVGTKMTGSSRNRLGKRIRSKLARWIKGTGAAMKKSAGKRHNRRTNIDSVHHIINV